ETTAGFYCLAFPLNGKGCAERPGAVQGAPLGAAQRTLDGEDRSEMMEPEGKPCVDSKRFLKREQARWECAERVSTMVLSQTRGLWLFSVIRGGIELTQRLSA